MDVTQSPRKNKKQTKNLGAAGGAARWSRYNCLFRSGDCGNFVYNSLSGALIELDDPHYAILESLRDGTGLPEGDASFVKLLKEKYMLIDPAGEEGILLAHHHMRQSACYDTSSLSLTICPTLACNFRCPYCFEPGQKKHATMNDETEDALTRFIRQYRNIRHLYVSWFGGEPLLAFDRICSLTARFRELGIPFEAIMVTNGYLLDKKKIDLLNDLEIRSILVTLDGPREIHDTRRVHAGGLPTYDRIIGNLSTLLDSSYRGGCAVRVNTDRDNMDEYIGFRAALLERFGERAPEVYPGQVHKSSTRSHDCSQCLNSREWSDFTLDLFNHGGILRRGGFYPGDLLGTLCTANTCQGFAVGPEGELYKCGKEVGRPGSVIGSVHRKDFISDPALEARYTVGTDPFGNQECLSCTTLPICGGGCASRRMRIRRDNEKDLEICSHYKERLEDYLRAYIRIFQTNEVCTMLLDPKKEGEDRTGYRVISPEVRREAETLE